MVDFDVADTQGSCDLGVVTLIDERTATMTAGNPTLYPAHRCGLFARGHSDEEVLDTGRVEYVVVTFHSDRALRQYGPGDWFDAKVMSGFEGLDEARIAFDEYGPSYLLGERLTWSLFRRL